MREMKEKRVSFFSFFDKLTPSPLKQKTGKKNSQAPGGVPFFAAGISSVMHPHNPFAPTMHFNYRYFETEDWNGVPGQWWFGAFLMFFFSPNLFFVFSRFISCEEKKTHLFLDSFPETTLSFSTTKGGGTDITPAYVDEEDMRHFHGIYKNVCDKHDPSYYAKFKKWADEYFWCKHREQTRGLGGIFFDDLNDRPKEEIVKFSAECLASVVPSYVPIVHKHKDDEFTTKQKEWQAMRRVSC